MRTFIATGLLFLLSSSARADTIGVFNQFSEYCYVRDIGGPVTLHVIHTINDGGTRSRFRIDFSEAMTGTLLSFSSPYATLTGSPMTGIEVEYGGCVLGDHVVLELSMLFSGTSGRCSWIRTGAHPSSVDGMLDVYNCAFEREPANWAGTHIDPVDPYSCPSDGCGCHGGCCCRPYSPPVPVQSTTWGKIKSLYY